MFARFSFYPTLVYNMVMERLTKRKWYDRIDQHVVLGALPFPSVARQLIKEEKVGGVVSMNEDYELTICYGPKEWAKRGVEFIQLCTTDIFSTPDQQKLNSGVDFIDSFQDTDRSVYVHCKAGRTRSATLVACYLMKKYSLKPNEAVSFIATKRPHILLHTKQREAIQTFYASLPHLSNTECS